MDSRTSRFIAIGIVAVAVCTTGVPPASGQTHAFVFADDGTALATDIYRPIGAGPFPVILIRTPYGKEDLKEACFVFAVFGYACVVQDTRGRGESTGTDTVFRNGAEDGRATIRWLTGQPWCDGNIGMFGGSAFGITEYLAAPGADSALRSVLSVAATPDLYHHAFVQGGAIRAALVINWLAGQDAGYFYDEVRQHRLKDAWWDAVEVLEHAGSVHTAGLHIGGWYDIFGQGTIDALTTFQYDGGSGAVNRQHLVMGPWTHGGLFSNQAGSVTYPENAAPDWLIFLVPWFRATLRGRDSAIEQWPVARVYLMGAADEAGAPGNQWVDLDRWPPRAKTRRMFLSEDGALRLHPLGPGATTLEMDPEDPVLTLGGANLYPSLVLDGRSMGDGPQDQRPIEERSDVLTFTSDVLKKPVAVMGPVRARIWIEPDTPDLDLAVRLTDVYPDGRSMLVLDGIQRARMRCGDDTECLLTPGQPVELTVEMWSTAIVFNAGHRIRISVSGSNWPRFEVNPNDGGDLNVWTPGIVARPKLLFGGKHQSRLELPTLSLRRDSKGRLQPAVKGLRIARETVSGLDLGPPDFQWRAWEALVRVLRGPTADVENAPAGPSHRPSSRDPAR